MQEVFSNFYDFITNTITSLGLWGPILGCFLIVLESIIPILPLFVFIAINAIAFGKVGGFLISWVCTVIGCSIAYFLAQKFSKYVKKKFNKNTLFQNILLFIQNLSLSQITIILAIPFTPAFMINVVAGITNIPFKRYLLALIISKIFLVCFWGLIGTGLIESFKHPINLVFIAIMVVLAYLITIIIKKVFKIDW